jgi:glycosyltransferase involved in cell wall biosynthesis
MKELAQMGHRVAIITSDSNQLAAPPRLEQDFLYQQVDGMQLCWVRTSKYSVAKSLRRIWSWLDFEWRLVCLTMDKLPKPDVVVVSSLSLLTVLNGLWLRARYKCRFVFEVRDIWPLTLTEEGGFKTYNPFVWFLGGVERLGYKYADAIVGTMPNLGEHVQQVLGYPKTAHCIPMGLDTATFASPLALPADYEEAYLPKGKFVVAHVGTIGITNALQTFLECAQAMQGQPHIHFLMVGDGDLRENYRRQYAHLNNLTFGPRVPKAMVQSVLAKCDLLYFSVHVSKIWRYGQSLNKVIDYMMAGKPVVASYTGYPSMINEANCGTFVPAGDMPALRCEVERYARMNITERQQIGARGIAWLTENRKYKKLAEEYESILLQKTEKRQDPMGVKQVWILNHYAQAPDVPGGTRHFHMAANLAKHGWNAAIISSSFDHSSKHQRLVGGEKIRLEALGGVHFLWVRTPAYTGSSFGRIFNMLTFTWKVLQRKITADLSPPDVVIGSSVHPFAALAGALLARRHGVPFIFEVRDLWPQTLIEMGRIKSSSAMAWALRKLELWLYKRAERVVVLLPKAWEYIVPLGIARQKVVWIPNGVDLELFPDPGDPVPSDVFTLMYFGSHGQANGLDSLLEAMKLVEQSPLGQKIVLRMVGDGPLKPTLMEQASDLGLKRISFEPPVPKSQMSALAAQADAFVLTVLNLPKLYRYGISMNKMYDYMAVSRPIILASNAANNPVADSKAGLSVEPGQPEALAQAILQIAATPLSERQRMGRAGRDYVAQNHDFSHLSARLATVLDEVFAEKQSR